MKGRGIDRALFHWTSRRPQFEESLRFVDRGLIEVPVDADLGRFLVSGGKLNRKPVLIATNTS